MACSKMTAGVCKRGFFCKYAAVCPYVWEKMRDALKKEGVVRICANNVTNVQKYLDSGYTFSADKEYLEIKLETSQIEILVFSQQIEDKNGCPYLK